MSLEDFLDHNKNIWEYFSSLNIKSKYYNVDKFINGNLPLDRIQLAALGDLNNKYLLHLQCNIGLETLSLARLGAKVIGIDASNLAINFANSLKEEIGLTQAKFICYDLYSEVYKNFSKFDIIYSSYGSICWLPDLKNWAESIASNLSEGGFFVMVDFHPILIYKRFLLNRRSYTYFNRPELPLKIIRKGNYADQNQLKETISYNWNHSISEILNSLLSVGLKLKSLNEYSYMPDNGLPNMLLYPDDYYHSKENADKYPLLLSLKLSRT